jgi:predicted ester cyclase
MQKTARQQRRMSFMSEENKQKVRRFLEEAFGQGRTEVIDEVVASDVVCHDPNSETGEIRGADTIKGEIGWMRGVFPDLFWRVEDQVAEGDKVTTRYTFGGTHQGELMGAAPTGRRVEMSGINIDRFEGGKLVEEWASYDMLGGLRQTGVIPEPQ